MRFSLIALAIVKFPRPVLDAIYLAEKTRFRENKNVGSNRDGKGLYCVVRSIEVEHRVFTYITLRHDTYIITQLANIEIINYCLMPMLCTYVSYV